MKEKIIVKQCDCLDGLKELVPCSIDLIYLDPPFFTQKIQRLKDENGNEYSFDDTWESLEEYLNYLKLRLLEMKRVLKNTGSIFLHCDSKASHYLRQILDEVFEYSNFRNEIIWTYKRWSNSKKGLLNGHQTIFWYSKTNDFKFNFKYVDYSSTTNLDQILQERRRNKDGKVEYKTNENGEVILGKEKKGVPLSDVWEIPYLNPKAKERTGYPTQKPILLLEQILEVASDKNDLILDPFCGSGTTLVTSVLMNRNCIGFDINPLAISLTKNRLECPIKTTSNLLLKGKEAYKTKTQKELKILEYLNCDIIQRNKGLDGILKKQVKGKQIGVKIQKETESLEVAVKNLLLVTEKKNFLFSILVKTKFSPINFKVPDKIKIIDTLDSIISEF